MGRNMATENEEQAVNISLDFQSMNPQHRVEVEEVYLDEMFIDPTIQRDEEPGEIAQIVAQFNEGALGTLTLSARGSGSYTVLDGQQRRAALLQLRALGQWGEHKKVRALVHYGLSLQEEAQLFLDLNFRRSVSPLRRFKTRIIAGDPMALKIKGILDEFNIPLGTTPKGFQAVTTVERIMRQEGGEDRFRWCLRIIQDVYDTGNGGCWDGRVIEGFALVHAAYVDQIDTDRLVKKLTSVGNHVSKLLGAGRVRQGIFRGEIHFHIGESIIEYYNKSNRANPKFPKSLPPLPRRKIATIVPAQATGQDDVK